MVFKASKKKGKAKKKKGRIKRLIAICTAISMLPNVIAVLFMSAALVIGAGTIYSTLFGDEVLEEEHDEYEITLKTTCVCGCRKVKGPADGSGNTGSTGNLDQTVSGSTNEEYIWNWFKAKGYDDVAVAGIVGNFGAESGCLPAIVQGHGGDEAYGKTIKKLSADKKNRIGYGLAQWTYYTRVNGLQAAADSAGKMWYDLELQLEYAWTEIQSTPAVQPKNLNQCQNTSSDKGGAGSVGVWMQQFEKPGTIHMGKRLYWAYNAMKKYGDLSKVTEGTDTVGLYDLELGNSDSTNKIWVKKSTLASAKGSDNGLLALTYDVKHEEVLEKKKDSNKNDKESNTGLKRKSGVNVPVFKGFKKNLVDHILPGAYAAEQYCEISAVLTLGQCQAERVDAFKTDYGSFIMPSSYPKGYLQFFGITGNNFITGKSTSTNSTKSGYRAYLTPTESAVDHGFYLSCERGNGVNFVSKVRSKYKDGYLAQIRGMSYTSYCTSSSPDGYYSSVSRCAKEYEMFLDHDVIEAYIIDNGLESLYDDALGWVKEYDKVYKGFYVGAKAGQYIGITSTPTTGTIPGSGSGSSGGSTESGREPVVDEDGVEGVDWHWECDCKIPCSKCSCHDNTGSSSGGGAVSGDLTLKEDKGKFQALWTDSSGKNMTQDNWDKLVQKYPPFNSGSYLNFVGVNDTPKNDYSAVSEDRFKKQFTDGVGYIHYTQGANGNSDMNGLIQHRGCTFSQAHLGQNFCGGFCTSMVMSTYLHRYVTPIEIAIAAETYSERHGKSIPMFADTEKAKSGVFLMSGASALFNEQRFNGEALFETSYKNGDNGTIPIPSQSELDSIIEKNGAVIFVARPDYHGLTGSGHYIWIRGKTSDGKYLLGNSTANATTYKNLNYEWSYSELQSVDKAQQYCIILPTKAYNNYISQASVKEEVDGDEAELGGGTPLKSGSKTRNNIVRFGMQFLGRPYVWGGTSLTNGCDCSGFVLSVYAHFGVSLPHQSTAMRYVGKSVPNPSPATMLPGDILCYEGHVALYDGKGNMLEAQSRRTGIMNNRAWNDKPVVCVRRIPISQIKVPK